jgi:1,2-phenylacetyl-CoA epoxidase catalytic subunit
MPYIKEAESSVTAGERKLDYFRIRMEDWVERTMTRVLAERTGGIQSIAGLGASYIPLAVWHARNYVDEALGHTAQGVRYAKDLVAQGRAAECQSAIDKFYASCLDIFGGVDTPNERRYLELGVKTLSNNQSRFLWIRSLERDLAELKLDAPAARWKGNRREYPPETVAETKIYLDADEVPADIRPLAQRLLAGWVQSKYARQNDPAVFAAPTPEEKLAVANQYRDDRHWGLEAARILARLGVDPDRLADEAERSLAGGAHKIDFLKQPVPEGWASIAMQQLIAARVSQAASLATFGSCLVPLAVWSGRHYEAQATIADTWRRRVAATIDAATRDAAQRVLADLFPLALDAFGGDDTPNEAAYCQAGLKTAANSHVRQIFIDLLDRDAQALGLALPTSRRGRRHNYPTFLRPGLAA